MGLRADGLNLRARGLNPRALGLNPKALRMRAAAASMDETLPATKLRKLLGPDRNWKGKTG